MTPMVTIRQPPRIRSKSDLDQGLGYLTRVEKRFTDALERVTDVPLRLQPQGFASLVSILVHQQVSLASAAAIWKRLEVGIDPFEPNVVLAFSDEKLKGLGLSRPKVRYLKALAEAVSTGTLDLQSLPQLSEAEVRALLTSVVGIGDWTADIYLLSCLGHPDIWPAKDIGLQVAAQDLLGLKNRPTAEELMVLAEPWRPWRAIAARLLWSYYREIKKLPPAR